MRRPVTERTSSAHKAPDCGAMSDEGGTRCLATHRTSALWVVVVAVNGEYWDGDVEVRIFVVDCRESKRFSVVISLPE